MKLLIITQVVDTEHPILGFFHRWIEEFSRHCEHVHVIALQVGKYDLPTNVTVHSLGKEKGKGRLAYLLRFYSLIWQLRNDYDNVFVHMNQIYVILGAPFWRAFGKKIGLWYMHGSVPASLRFAEKCANIIFTGAKEGFNLKTNKVVITGHGIDTARFAPQTVPKDIDLITVGRISPIKKIDILLDVLSEMRKESDVTLTIVGTAVTDIEKIYEQELQQKISELSLGENVIFIGKVSQRDLPSVLNRSKIFVTAAQNGSLDKAVLEAIACGLPIVSMAPGTLSLPLGSNQVMDKVNFTLTLRKMLESESFTRSIYAEFISHSHSLQQLIPSILKEYDRL